MVRQKLEKLSEEAAPRTLARQSKELAQLKTALTAGLPHFRRFATVHTDDRSRRRIEFRHLVIEVEGQPLASDTQDHALMPLGNWFGVWSCWREG
jgi:hypothetical protein